MNERTYIKRRLVRAISQIQHGKFEPSYFLLIALPEPDSTVFFFLKNLPYAVFLDFLWSFSADSPNVSSTAVRQLILKCLFV